eukprot:TRINITY_DN15470_c0_g1_i1.p1 TRINITY_DN15470_c0_g1~~TRINITY_DN15470_c0_g1_i1.p1  ORF type:complete len:528 (+),score=66.52 TRINITY_DN15470_c0_g1_i1:175-1584(+)
MARASRTRTLTQRARSHLLATVLIVIVLAEWYGVTHLTLVKPSFREACLNIVLCGRTGAGKSFTGNTLSGKKNAFKVSGGFDSQTQKCSHVDFQMKDGQKARVVDVAGFADTRLSPQEEKQFYSTFVDRVSSGVDVFVLCISCAERFTAEADSCLRRFTDMHGGNSVWNHVLMVFTKVGELSNESIQEKNNSARSQTSLRHWMEQASEVVWIDNQLDPEAATQELEAAIARMGGRGLSRWENHYLREAQEFLDQVQSQVDMLPRRYQESACQDVDQFHHGRIARDELVQKVEHYQREAEHYRKIEQEKREAQERAEQEARKREQEAQERLAAQERAEQEMRKREQAERERQAAEERAEQETRKREQEAQERLAAQERAEQEMRKREQAERERQAADECARSLQLRSDSNGVKMQFEMDVSNKWGAGLAAGAILLSWGAAEYKRSKDNKSKNTTKSPDKKDEDNDTVIDV